MQLPLSQQVPPSASNATGATNDSFIETVEYDRFIEFSMPVGGAATSASATALPELERRFPGSAIAAAK
jgi:hypothetical protein